MNHDVSYRGRAYHVQTEDLGAANPHVVTHLFEGGNVIAATRTSYAEQLQAQHLAPLVRQLMERQHKEVLRALVHGAYDDRLDAAARTRAFRPGELAPAPAPVQAAPASVQSAAAPVKPAPPPRAPPAPERDWRRSTIPAPLPPPPGVGAAAPVDTEEPDDSIDRAILAYLAGDGEGGAR